MSLRRWFREKVLGSEATGDDLPPSSVLLNTVLGREEERVRSLGEYDSGSYPHELRALLTRRDEVTRELLTLNVTSRASRVAAIPRLREMLRTYPHPLVYETLMLAYLDSGRWDEAKGIAFAARQRRMECERSPHPEIRDEISSLKEWSQEDIDEDRKQTGPR